MENIQQLSLSQDYYFSLIPVFEETNKCTQNNDVHFICSKKYCKQNAFTCRKQSCPCRIKHNLCSMTEPQTVIKKLSQKTLSTQHLQAQINNLFDKLIDRISDFRDKLLQDIPKVYQLFGLNEKQKKVYNVIRCKTDEQIITGSDIWEVCFDKVQQQNIPTKIEILIQKSSGKFYQFEKYLQIFLNGIQTEIIGFPYVGLREKKLLQEEKTTKKQNKIKILVQDEKIFRAPKKQYRSKSYQQDQLPLEKKKQREKKVVEKKKKHSNN